MKSGKKKHEYNKEETMINRSNEGGMEIRVKRKSKKSIK